MRDRIAKIFNVKRIILYVLALLILGGIATLGWYKYNEQQKLAVQFAAQSDYAEKLILATRQYQETVKLLKEAKNNYPEIDLNPETDALVQLWDLIKAGKLDEAKAKYIEIINSFNAKVADEDSKILFHGTIAYKTALADIDIEILMDGNLVKTIKSTSDGTFSTRLAAGKYTIKISASGYNAYSTDVVISAESSESLDIVLSKPAAVTTSSSSSVSSGSDGLYSKITVDTDRGSFSVLLLTVDLSQYQMIVDTAADTDCENGCPVLSLAEYVARNEGVAGIHGTYFCPTAYPDCAAKTNSFYFKMVNGRTGQKINWSNGLGDYLPFLSVSGNTLSYYPSWSSVSGMTMSTGISCRPHLVEGGRIVLTPEDLDSDKEATYKMSHGFLGHIGQVVYAGVVLSANLYDSAAVSQALGLEDSFNLDGGGTTAMYNNGSYKIGPGRSMPNAIVFKRR